MFLPDGRVLIMDSEQYKQTIERSIVLDLFDGTSLGSNQSASSGGQAREENNKEEEKLGYRSTKEAGKKTSQANQRKNRNDSEVPN